MSIYEIDKLITEAKKRRLASQEKIAAMSNRTDISTANIGASSRERVASIQGRYGIKQEHMQQRGATARENLTIAGNKVLQELQGRQAMERQKVSGTQSMERVQEAGVQARETAKQKNKFSRQYLDYVLENLGTSGAGQYTYNPTGSDTSDLDIEDYLSF